MIDAISKDNGSIQTVLIEVAKSYPFRNRRDDTFQLKSKSSPKMHYINSRLLSRKLATGAEVQLMWQRYTVLYSML